MKHSRQREAILEYLQQTTAHPTADMVYLHVRKVIPNISLGTVYRNLNQLVGQGEVLRLSCGDDCDRFDGTVSPHYHFRCTQCHEVSDLVTDPLEHINLIAGAGFGGRIDGHSVYFYGICPDCLANEKECKIRLTNG